MSNIWITSDSHFNHANILKFKDKDDNPVRSFSSVEEMNEILIERWNSVVKSGDKVYHLGDVFFGPKDWIENNWNRLNGNKRLIVGNHDDIPYICGQRMFQKVDMWRMFTEHHLLLTHVPVSIQTLNERKYHGKTELINVHGHIHQNDPYSEHYINVSVERTNYTPVNIEELRKKV